MMEHQDSLPSESSFTNSDFEHESNASDAEADESLFFADATLEDAHHLVDSPGGEGIREKSMESSSSSNAVGIGNSGGGGGELAANNDAKKSLSVELNEEEGNGGVEGDFVNVTINNGTTKQSTLLESSESNTTTTNHEMNRISNMDVINENRKTSGNDGTTPGESNNNTTQHHNPPLIRRKPPRTPRDIQWVIGALVFIPLSLFLPFYITNRYPDKYKANHQGSSSSASVGPTPIHGWKDAASSPRGHIATFCTALLAYAAASILSRIMYRNPASGGDGEDARHFAASQIAIIGNYVALAAYPTLIALLYTEFPHANNAALWTIVLIGLFCRDFRMLRRTSSRTLIQDDGHGRRIFFKTLTCMSLDILSRSLRRMSFYRIVSAVMFVQLILVVLWRSALFVALSIPVRGEMEYDDNGDEVEGENGATHLRNVLILLVLIGGKWATGIVARVLGLIASGGITVWFAQQSVMLEEMHARSADLNGGSNSDPSGHGNTTRDASSNGSKFSDSGSWRSDEEEDSNSKQSGKSNNADTYSSSSMGSGAAYRAGAARGGGRMPPYDDHSFEPIMPEAYRSVDANAYRSVNDFDDFNMYGSDDEEEDPTNAEFGGLPVNDFRRNFRRNLPTNLRSMGRRIRGALSKFDSNRNTQGGNDWTSAKSFLVSACTVSFGSVAQCGLLGGLAQFVWTVIRNADVALQRQRTLHGGSQPSGFRGMDIELSARDAAMGVDGNGGLHMMGPTFRGGFRTPGEEEDMRTSVMKFCKKFLIRCHALARRFVRSHSDLAMSHVAAYFKSYQRAAMDVVSLVDASGVEPIIHDDITTAMCTSLGIAISGWIVVFIGVTLSHHRGYLSDTVVCDILVISFLMSYTIVFTIMEPLRASIKAVYVCFAQHPESLSQAFPLVFHRLTRISETNVLVV